MKRIRKIKGATSNNYSLITSNNPENMNKKN